jgi:triosephosphate isomerase
MTSKLTIANWKMNGNLEQIRNLLSQLFQDTAQIAHSREKVVICPPYCYQSFVIGRLAEFGWQLGGQDCSRYTSGAYTGEISAEMLKVIGCRYVLVGHSERRQHHHESNALVRQKMQQALKAGLTPVLCIGETLQEREAGLTLKIIENQLYESMAEVNTEQEFVVAYEPVWAIGTGRVAGIQDITQVHQHIKSLLVQSNPLFESIPVLYGGSVNGQNAREILSLGEVDGVLVGGASLKADEFTTIIAAAAQTNEKINL